MAEKTVPTTQENRVQQPQETTRSQKNYVAPPVDIFEKEDRLIVVADLPGADKESVNINVEDGLLTIEAETKNQAPTEPIFREFEMVNFFRQFELSERVDVEKITAEMKNGVLTLNLPKVEKAKPKRIEVKTS